MSPVRPARNLSVLLKQGTVALGVSLDDAAFQRCLDYIALLSDWNRAYNLTAVRDPERMVPLHLLDSLTVLPHLGAGDCLDIGTGAGLPGLILAIARPDTHWLLLDSNHKKIRFVSHAISRLGVANAEAVCCRVEAYRSPREFSALTARACGSLGHVYRHARHLMAPATRLLLMKGPDIRNELAQLDGEDISLAIHTLKVPGVARGRTLVVVQPAQAAVCREPDC